MRPDPDPALSIRFDVKIDGVALGSFTGCEGLTVEYDVLEYEEGGNNAFVHRLPGRAKYGNVKLSRAVDVQSTMLAMWFASLAQFVQRKTAVVAAFDGNRRPIARWTINGVWPIRYTGPTLASDGSGVAIETLELAHEGFRLT